MIEQPLPMPVTDVSEPRVSVPDETPPEPTVDASSPRPSPLPATSIEEPPRPERRYPKRANRRPPERLDI